jgi:hypothetical protein
MAKRPNPAKIRRRGSKAVEANRAFDEARAAERPKEETKSDPLTEEKLLLFQRSRETSTRILDFAGVEDAPPLIEAIAASDVEAVTAALSDKGSLGETVEAETKEGSAELVPMDVAIDAGDPAVIAALLEAGIDVNDHWLFPNWLHAYVSLYPAATALTYQVDVGAKSTIVGQRTQLFKRHPDFVRICRLLVNAGADPNAYDDYEETTAAKKAARFQITDLEDLFGPPQESESASA